MGQNGESVIDKVTKAANLAQILFAICGLALGYIFATFRNSVLVEERLSALTAEFRAYKSEDTVRAEQQLQTIIELKEATSSLRTAVQYLTETIREVDRN